MSPAHLSPISATTPGHELPELASSRESGFVIEWIRSGFVENCTGVTNKPMTKQPLALRNVEIKEIASIAEIQQMWGAQDSEEMESTLKESYAVKFDFVSGSPGYVGDLFLIEGDALDGAVPPVRLIRNKEDKLEILR